MKKIEEIWRIDEVWSTLIFALSLPTWAQSNSESSAVPQHVKLFFDKGGTVSPWELNAFHGGTGLRRKALSSYEYVKNMWRIWRQWRAMKSSRYKLWKFMKLWHWALRAFFKQSGWWPATHRYNATVGFEGCPYGRWVPRTRQDPSPRLTPPCPLHTVLYRPYWTYIVSYMAIPCDIWMNWLSPSFTDWLFLRVWLFSCWN